MSDNRPDILEHVASIVSAYVENNNLASTDLPGFIQQVHASLAALGQDPVESERAPGVDPRRSVQPNHIVCLEDGKRYQSLKRHLAVEHGLTPDQYRAKWGLPSSYPMVAPQYSEIRSRLAVQSGLGRVGRKRGRGPKGGAARGA